ncbi:MAG: substrate-binding domain-containing protein [Candidatus Nanopelagicales bacterium]
MNAKKALIAAAAGAGALSLMLAVIPTASADPDGPPQYRDLAGVGSDTTMDLVQALSQVVTINSAKVIGSYNASPSTTESFQTKADAKCTFTRAAANGSSNGVKVLDTSTKAGDGCIQFARSSSAKSSSSPTGYTWIPFAKDAVTFAVRSDGQVAKSLSVAELTAIYKCENTSIVPVLPQAGSGTRSYWLARFGITEDQITAGTYPCLKPKSAGGTGAEYEQEHDGRTLKANEIQPYSIAVWQAQASGAAPDRRGMTVLGVLGDQAPTLLNTSSVYSRDVFNVVPTTKVTDTASKEYQVFVGKDSLVCKQSAVIAQQGFGVLATTCGDTSSRS